MPLQNELIERVRKRFGLLASSPPSEAAPVDFLVKMNLPPLMGRRDAASERIVESAGGDIFACPAGERNQFYRRMTELTSVIVADTEAIMGTLSSPDTETRERRVLQFWLLVRELALTLEMMTRVGEKLFHPVRDLTVELPEPSPRDEKLLSETEISLVNQIRELFESARPQLERYRSYARNSFSKSNAERYNKAYKEYLRLYA